MALDRKKLQEAYESQEPSLPVGHSQRFEERLQKMNAPKTGRSIRMWVSSVAAAAVIIVAVVIYNTEQSQQLPEATALSEVSPEMSDFEHYYRQEVEKRTAELMADHSDNPRVVAMLNELEKLEADYQELKLELGYNSNSDAVIRAMIDNYRLRLNLLERMLKKNIENNQNQINHENA